MSHTHATDRALDRRIWPIGAIASLGPLLTNLDSTVVNVSLSTIGRELHAGLAISQWVVTAYLLALALMLPLSGWLVDRIGAKRVYLGCFALFTLASALCGMSNTMNALIGARILQGMAGGLLAPMAQMMVARQAPGHIARVMGVLVIPVLLGPIFGPSMAGLILQQASWRWIFFINLPIGVCSIALASWILPNDGASPRRRRFDLAGFLLISPALVVLLYGLETLGAGSEARSRDLAAILMSLTLLSVFVVRSVRLGTLALLDVNLFRDRSFSASALTMFLANGVNFGGQLLVPLALLSVLRLSPEQAGLLLASAGLGMLCSAPFMGALTERLGARRVSSAGALIGLAGTLPFALVPMPALPLWSIGAALFLRGVGIGATSVPAVASAYASIPREDIPAATTTLNIVQRLGGPAATTALAIFLHARTPLTPQSAPGALALAFNATFWLLSALHAAAILAALGLAASAESRAREAARPSPT